jgi:uncharacterized protein (TIGR02996 family)
VNRYSRTAAEQALLAEIRRDPGDMSAWLIYADWLEERGEPRAAEIRRQCQWRLPFADSDVAWLAAIEGARQSASVGDVRVAIDMHKAPPLGIADPAVLATDLHHLNIDEIARNFPRGDEGHLQTGDSVLLAAYASDLGNGAAAQERNAWLVAEADADQAKPGSIVVRVAERVASNHRHVWSKARWLWDRRSAATDATTRFGFPAERLAKIEFFDRAERLAEFERQLAAGRLAEFDRQALCVLLLDEARFAEALALYGIRLSPSIQSVLTALPSRTGLAPSTHFQESWIPFLRRQIWRMAPWKMSRLMERQRLIGGASQKRLAALPNQPYAAKLSLLLGFEESETPVEAGEPWETRTNARSRLYLETTNSIDLLPEIEWARPIELDIARIYSDATTRSPISRVP